LVKIHTRNIFVLRGMCIVEFQLLLI
jgi:hypothetical protein